MLIRLLPLYGGVIPVLAVTLAYWLGVDNGILPSCNPWLDGCTSISSTGRHAPGSYLFRAIELPFAMVLVFIWYFSHAWLNELCGGNHRRTIKIMFIAGVTAAMALIIYVTFLGTSELIYEYMRRFGIYVFFLGTATAQLLLSLLIAAQTNLDDTYGMRGLSRQMIFLAALPVFLGVLNLILKSVMDYTDAVENSIEWIASLSMQIWFVFLYLVWRRTGFGVIVTTSR